MRVLFLWAFVLASGGAFAQWPTKPVRMVVAFPPGGSTDIAVRLLAERIAPALGQQVLVENRTGASGNVAAEYVVKQPADGHLVLATADALASTPHLFEQKGLVLEQWLGLFVASGAPGEAVVRLNAEINRALGEAPVRERFASYGLEPVGGTPEQFSQLYRDDYAMYARLTRELNIKLD